MTRHLLEIQVETPKTGDRYRYDGQGTYLSGPITTAPDGITGFAAGSYRIFYDAESAGEEYGFEFVVSDGGSLFIGEPFKRDPADENYAPLSDLHSVARQGNETSLPLLTAGYRAYSFPDVITATHILVEQTVQQGGQSVKEIARLSIASLASSGAVAPVWETGTVWEQAPISAEQTLIWGFGAVWEQVPISAPSPLVAPTGLRALRTAGTRNAVLSWVDNANDETGYEVERSLNGTDFTPLIPLEANVTVLPLNGLELLTPTWYRVRAVRGNDTSTYTAGVKLELIDFSVLFFIYGQGNPPEPIRQLLPGSVSITPGVGNLGAVVTLPGGSAPTAADYDQVSLDVRKPDAVRNNWNYPAAEARATPYFAYPRPDGSQLPPAQYELVLTIYKDGQAIQVNSLTATLSAGLTLPATPSLFRAQRNNGQTGVVLSWADNASNEDSFEIQWKQPNGQYNYLNSAQANQTSLTSLIAPLLDGAMFQIRAVNNAGNSGWAETTLLVTPVTPTGLQTYGVELGIQLIWNVPQLGGAIWPGQSLIERATGNSTSFLPLGSIVGGNTYDDTTAVIGQPYSYRVKSIDVATGIASAYSNTITATRVAYNGN